MAEPANSEHLGPDYSQKPNARPEHAESAPDPDWTRWRLLKQRPEIKNEFPVYFPDIRKDLHAKLSARVNGLDDDEVDEPRAFKARSISSLRRSYEPTQLGFRPLTEFYDESDRINARFSRRARIGADDDGNKIPSLWFERMANDLFARVWDFSSETFGLGASVADSYNTHDWTRSWLEKLPNEFVNYASEVARGDPAVRFPKQSDPNNWEHLFLDDMSRVKLMVGIIAKTLEKNVFDSLLFGARDIEKAALATDCQAKSFIEDSYQRNRSRSETVRNFIQGNRAPSGAGLVDLFTDNFWDEVDSVTMGILDLLLPLINLLGKTMPHVPWPCLTRVHQGLHDIVAEAAWFTNGMRATKSIFWVEFPLPGELYDSTHEHAIDDIWRRSKREATSRDAEALTLWRNTMNADLAKKNPGVAITQAHQTAYQLDKPRPVIRRTAKVQVAMWPFIKRFTPVRETDAGDGVQNSGEIITQIMKAQIVYYAGDDSDAGDMRERLTLKDHLASRRRLRKWTSWKAVLLFSLIALLFYLASLPHLPNRLTYRDWVNWTHKTGTLSVAEHDQTTRVVTAVPIGTVIIQKNILYSEVSDHGVTMTTPAPETGTETTDEDSASNTGPEAQNFVPFVDKVTVPEPEEKIRIPADEVIVEAVPGDAHVMATPPAANKKGQFDVKTQKTTTRRTPSPKTPWDWPFRWTAKRVTQKIGALRDYAAVLYSSFEIQDLWSCPAINVYAFVALLFTIFYRRHEPVPA